MKILFFLLQCLLCANCYSQTEFHIPWNDSFSIEEINQFQDNNQNLYILGVLNSFDTTSNRVAAYEGGDNGAALIIFDKSGRVIAKEKYEISEPFNFQFFNSYSFITYNKYFGIGDCYGTNAALGRSLIINSKFDKSNAQLLHDFSIGRNRCGSEVPIICYADGHNLDIIYSNDSAWRLYGLKDYFFYEQVVDSNLIVVHDSLFYPLNYIASDSHYSNNPHSNVLSNIVSLRAIEADTFSNQFIAIDGYSVYIYDKQWNLVTSKSILSYIPISRGCIGSAQIKYNAKYYVINLTFLDSAANRPVSYYIILSKDGNLYNNIADRDYQSYIVTEDDKIIAVSSDGSREHPLTLIQTDLFGNIERKIPFGGANTSVKGIALTGDMVKSAIVTGTTKLSKSVPAKPDVLYYFRIPLNEIPSIFQTSCSGFSLLPNPALGKVTLTSDSNLLNAHVRIFDQSGKVMVDQLVKAKITSFNTSLFPKGVYYLNVISDNTDCTMKFIME